MVGKLKVHLVLLHSIVLVLLRTDIASLPTSAGNQNKELPYLKVPQDVCL